MDFSDLVNSVGHVTYPWCLIEVVRDHIPFEMRWEKSKTPKMSFRNFRHWGTGIESLDTILRGYVISGIVELSTFKTSWGLRSSGWLICEMFSVWVTLPLTGCPWTCPSVVSLKSSRWSGGKTDYRLILQLLYWICYIGQNSERKH